MFDGNDADYTGTNIVPRGAALYMSNLVGGSLNISDSRFIGNRAGFSGGALFLATPNAYIARSLFQQNSISGSNGASGAGGAVFVDSGAAAEFSACTFRNNSINFINSTCGSAIGSAFSFTAFTYVIVKDSTFINNRGLQYSHGAVCTGFAPNATIVRLERPYFCNNVAGPVLSDFSCAGGTQSAVLPNVTLVQSAGFRCQGSMEC